jgi:hypothetical protein
MLSKFSGELVSAEVGLREPVMNAGGVGVGGAFGPWLS